MKKSELEIIREYVRESLVLESYEAYGMYSGGSVYKALVEPWKDVIEIGIGKVKEIASGFKQLAHISISALLETLSMGLIKANYDQIHNTYKNEVSQIQSSYRAALERSHSTLKNSGFAVAAMLYNPGVFLTSKFIYENPKLALDAAMLATVGTTAVGSKLLTMAGLPTTATTGTLAAAGAIAKGKALKKTLDIKDWYNRLDEKKLIKKPSKHSDNDSELAHKLLKLLPYIKNEENLDPKLLDLNQSLKSAIDEYFTKIKSFFDAPITIENVEKLLSNSKDKELSELLASLKDPKISEEEKKQIKEKIAKIVDAIKPSYARDLVVKLTEEKNQIIKQLKEAGVPDDMINDPGLQPARWQKEIDEISKKFGVGGSNKKEQK